MEAAEVVAKLAELPGGQALTAASDGDDSVWLVGGAVRDLMLSRDPKELDVLVDGQLDGMIEKLGGSAERFERFGTATVDLDGARIDLASARTETYGQPGALPDVTPASIDEDLQRRDFTINAIAVRLSDGNLKAHETALADLAAGTIRVLHSRSFSDDPTRLWRCARYCSRLGFSVEPETAALAATATPGAVSGERIGNELRLALFEPSPTDVFERVAALNAGALVEGFDTKPKRLDAALELLGDSGRRDLLTLSACSEGVELDLLTRWLDFLQFTSSERDLIAIASRWVTAAPLRNAQTPAEIASAARGAPIEAVALGGGDNARRWIEELRFVELEIGGDELIAAGVEAGPAVGAALPYALSLTLDGEIAGAEQQLAAALAHARGAAE